MVNMVAFAAPVEVGMMLIAADRARHREDNDVTRARDAYERDDDLQRRTGELYAGLAANGFCGRWQVAGPDVDPASLAGLLGP